MKWMILRQYSWFKLQKGDQISTTLKEKNTPNKKSFSSIFSSVLQNWTPQIKNTTFITHRTKTGMSLRLFAPFATRPHSADCVSLCSDHLVLHERGAHWTYWKAWCVPYRLWGVSKESGWADNNLVPDFLFILYWTLIYKIAHPLMQTLNLSSVYADL